MIEAVFSSMLSLKYTVKLFSPMKSLFEALRNPGVLWQKVRPPSVASGRMACAIPLTSAHAGSGFGQGGSLYQTVVEGYQTNPVVYRCVTLIARSLGAVKMKVLCDGKQAPDHPVTRVLAAPHAGQPYAAWMEALVTTLLLDGNAFVHATHIPGQFGADQKDRPVALQVLRPDRVGILTDAMGQVTGYQYRVGQHRVEFGYDAEGYCPVLHLRLFNPMDDHRGMSPLVPARLAVAMHTQSTRHNVALAENQCRPSGLLFVRGKTLDDETRLRLEDSLRQLGSGGAGSMLLLNGDFEWKDLGIRPRDMDFVQLMQETLRNIADCLGVPEPCLNSGDRSQYPGYFDAARALFWEETLLPLLDMIRTGLELWMQPLWPGVGLVYDKDSIDALVARREKFSEKVANCRDVLTLNEQRALLGYPPMAGGDTLACHQQVAS